MIPAVLFISLLGRSVKKSALIEPQQRLERTAFQTGHAYSDVLNSRADVAIVYGIDKGMPARVRGWRDKAYVVHLMTGVSWGEYQDYLYGHFDGKNHEDEAQQEQGGQRISHGGDVYYMSPGPEYGKFLCLGVQRALDAGVAAIHLEEPEFWNRGGYGPGFKREWKLRYGTDWQDPLSSPDARWKAAKLMYFLYRRALQQVFSYVQSYNLRTHHQVRCYVATHSLLNYAHWGIVSPESSLAQLDGCDGYIAQVWTGTARTPNVYEGRRKERTFETAYLEYGAAENMVRGTNRKMWFLADPVEDNPSHGWADYRKNWEMTLVASLLHPDVWRYEVMPWPERIFPGNYGSVANPKVNSTIPEIYQSELEMVFHALKDMREGTKKLKWDRINHEEIGVMVSDSLMFERGGPSASDPDMSQFYGLALPLVNSGYRVRPVQLENVGMPRYLSELKMILMSYEGMKPLTPNLHAAIAKWVRAGGRLIFIDADLDPFNRVQEWWNSGSEHWKFPRQHLFHLLGAKDKAGSQRIGKGELTFVRRNPSELAHGRVKASVVNLIEPAENHLQIGFYHLNRGKYTIVGAPEEDHLDQTLVIGSNLYDLFEGGVYTAIGSAGPGTMKLYVALDQLPRNRATLVACTGDVMHEHTNSDSWEGEIVGIECSHAKIALRLPRKPTMVLLDGKSISYAWTPEGLLAEFSFHGQAAPQTVVVKF